MLRDGERVRLVAIEVTLHPVADDGESLRPLPGGTLRIDAADIDSIPDRIREALAES